jgi:FkbM family methyltransferase
VNGLKKLQLFLQIVKPGDIVVNAGSNIGAFTVPLAKAVGPRGHVHAFEPQKIINQYLNANDALNNLHNVDIYLSALGHESGSIKVPYLNYSAPGNFGGIRPAVRPHHHEILYSISQVTLDDIDFLNPMTGLNCLNFLKMDVELMMELLVLRGGANMNRRCRPIIHAENNYLQTSKDLLSSSIYWSMCHFGTLSQPIMQTAFGGRFQILSTAIII